MFKHSYLNVIRQGSLAAVLAVGAASCGDSDDSPSTMPPPGQVGADPDPTTLPPQQPNPNGGESGFDDTINQQLAALADSQCVWTSGTGTLAITLNAGQIVVISKRSGVADVVVNNQQCPLNTTVPAGTITDATLKTLTINGSATASAETVVLDYSNGFFAMGSGTAGMTALGTNIDLKTGTDSVKIRMLSTADAVVCGSTAASAGVHMCNVNGLVASEGNIADLKTFLGVESVHFGLGDGADYFFGQGSNTATPTVVTNTWATHPFGVQLVVHGGLLADELVGGKAADTMNGAEGNDTIFGEGVLSGGADIFVGGAGTGDVISYAARTAAEGVHIKLTGTAVSGKTAGAETDTVGSDFENVIGGAGPDVIVGTAGNNTISGGAGNDSINGNGNASADTLNGDAGDDTFETLMAASNTDVLDGGDGTDTVDYSAGNTRVAAQTINLAVTAANSGLSGENDSLANIENCIGGGGIDTITGGAGINRIEGRGGADVINAGTGDDLIIEGGYSTAANGADDIDGQGGFDTVSYEGRSAGVTVTLAVDADNDGETGETDDLNGIERVIGTESADTMSCHATLFCHLEGMGAIDNLTGSTADDQLEGGVGEDVYVCGDGNDLAVDDPDQVTIAADCEIKQ